MYHSVAEVDSGECYACAGARSICEFSILSAQFCYESETFNSLFFFFFNVMS